MKRLAFSLVFALAIFAFPVSPVEAQAEDFGLHDFDVTFVDADGNESMQAGSHPFAMKVSFKANTQEENDEVAPVAQTKDLELGQVVGLAGIPEAVPRCETADFLIAVSLSLPDCVNSSVLGIADVEVGEEGSVAAFKTPIYNLEPPPGVAAKLGLRVLGVGVAVEVNVNESPPYNVVASVRNISTVLEFHGAVNTLWGTPASPAHDDERGSCFEDATTCPAEIPEVPFLITPRACEGPLTSTWRVDSWQNPGMWVEGSALTHDDAGNSRGFGGCGRLGFAPRIASQPTNRSAESPSGLDFDLEIDDEGLTNPASEGLADSDIKKTVVALPEGVTINPSQAEGLQTCSESDLARETSASPPGQGCPQASKVGTVRVESKLLEGEIFEGELFVATPYENPFGTLIAVYVVIKDADLGILIKQPIKVEPDPETGQLISTAENMPQLPFSHFHLHFREGGRSPLITPSRCGTYTTKAVLTPWANPETTYEATSDFEITSGVGGNACPAVGIPPFHPDFSAGSLNNAAAAYTPFHMRLTRADGEQDMTKFSSILPPGLLGKLAGLTKCPDAAITGARLKDGRDELAAPSCPASSQIGRITAGAGVGSQLTYVGGSAYLAGPYNGAPLSVAVISPAVAGPFDAGTVVVRVALNINSKTAEVEVDGSRSDPIPHILQGIVLKVRDIRVNVDRPNFVLNPTSCRAAQVKATLFGSFLDVFNPADDVPVSLADRFQAASCASLGFDPRIIGNLKGGTKRGAHPALRVVYRPRPGDANVRRLALSFPRSAFVENAHFRSICTRVQFAAGNCPQASIYGHARAFTPLLDEPLEGPVYLRSSDNLLPDAVFALRGIVDAEVAVRIDSVKGRLRATVSNAPDVPVSKVVVSMRGGDKGLFVNSRSLCGKAPNRAEAKLTAQSGKRKALRPVFKAKCPKVRKAQRRGSRP